MKRSKWSMLCAVAAFLAIGVSACQPTTSSNSVSSSEDSSESSSSSSSSSVPTEQKLNLLGKWADGGDGVYTFAENTATSLKLSYEKTEGVVDQSWSIAKVELTEDLSSYKTLRFTASGQAILKIKLETPTGSKEVDIKVTGVEAAYEWNLMADSAFLGDVNKVIIFGHPGKKVGTGNATFTKFEFTTETADGTIINTGFNNVPTNTNEYNGTDATFSFNAKWEDNGDGVYEITYDGTKTNVVYTKATGHEWSFMRSNVFGQFAGFDYITVKASGTKDKTFLFKAANGVETIGKFKETDVVQTFVLDISGMTDDAKNGMKEVLVFAEGGTLNSGTLTIHEAYFTTVNEAPAPVYETNVYDGTGETFSFNQNWHDNGNSDYEVTMNGTDSVITYSKSDTWTTAKSKISGNFADFDYITLKVQGTKDKTVMFKVEANGFNVEKKHTFTGEVDTIDMDLRSLSATTRNMLASVLLFAEEGQNAVSGTITIKEAYFNNTAVIPEPTEQVVHQYTAGSSLYANTMWYDGADGVYDVYKQDNIIYADYTKGTFEYPSMKSFVNGALSNLPVITLVIKGPVDQECIIKAGSPLNIENKFTFTGEFQTVTVDLSNATVENRDALKEILIMAAPGQTGVTGTLEIKSMTLGQKTAAYDGVAATFNVPTIWYDNDGITGPYTVTNTETESTVAYAKNNQPWACIVANVNGDFTNMSKIVFNLEGDPIELLLKIEGTAVKEVRVTISATATDYEFDLSDYAGKAGITKVVIFALPGVEGTLNGTFTINSVTFQ